MLITCVLRHAWTPKLQMSGSAVLSYTVIKKAYGSSGPTVHSLYCDVKCRIAGFQSRDTRLALGGQLQMET